MHASKRLFITPGQQCLNVSSSDLPKQILSILIKCNTRRSANLLCSSIYTDASSNGIGAMLQVPEIVLMKIKNKKLGSNCRKIW